MANARYPYTSELFLAGSLSWTGDPITVMLIGTSAYTYSDAHRYRSDIPVAMEIAVGGTLENRTVTGGVADADDYSFGTTVFGGPVDAVVVFKDTGSRDTSPLIVFCDSGSNLPLNPLAFDVQVVWDNSTNKIFRI